MVYLYKAWNMNTAKVSYQRQRYSLLHNSSSVSNTLILKLVLLFCIVSLLTPSCDAGNVNKLEFNPEGIPKSIRHILTNDMLTLKSPVWMQTEFPYSFSGFDDYNRPIWIVQFGKWDTRKMVERGGEGFEKFDKHMNQAFYRILASRMRNSTTATEVQLQNQKQNSPFLPHEFICIYDFKSLGMAQVRSNKNTRYLKNKLKSVLPTFDHAKVVYIVNVTVAGRMLINFLKPTFGELFKKAVIFGTNENDWKPKLGKLLPRDQIPSEYGGFGNSTSSQFFG